LERSAFWLRANLSRVTEVLRAHGNLPDQFFATRPGEDMEFEDDDFFDDVDLSDEVALSDEADELPTVQDVH
jgi:hypothetical protein